MKLQLKRRAKNVLLLLLIAALLLSGCGASPLSGRPDPIIIGDLPLPLAEAAPATPTILLPTRPGTTVYSSGGMSMDVSNKNQGYFSIKYSGYASRIKVQITRSGGITYTQDLRTDGVYEVFPFTQGSGSYTINVYEHVGNSMYTLLYGTTVTVTLASSTLPFLYPNQYVNYTGESAVVKKAAELTAAEATDLDRVAKIYNYVINNISYDREKAATVKSGYLPVVDTILSTGKGICFDYGSVMASMLRSIGIPTRLEIGYVSGGAYHAWISVYTAEAGWVSGAIYFDGVSWKLMDPTFASSGAQSASIMQYIGDGKNYSTSFYY